MHIFTKNPAHITRDADIVIAAAGVPNLVRGNWLKPGAVVVDVGTNPIEVCWIFIIFAFYSTLLHSKCNMRNRFCTTECSNNFVNILVNLMMHSVF